MTVTEYLERLLQLLSVEDAAVSLQEDEDSVCLHIDLPEQEAGRVIGHRGEAMAAIQRLIRIIFMDELGDKKLTLDINDYRQQRHDQLTEMALNAAHQVLETGEEYTFPYLPSYERYIIHSVISANEDFSEVETFSSGEGRSRRLVMRRLAS